MLLPGRFRPDLSGFMPIFPGKDALLFGKRCLCLPEKVGSFSQDIRYFSRNGGGFFGKNFRMERKNGIRGLKMPDIFSGMKIFTNHHFSS